MALTCTSLLYQWCFYIIILISVIYSCILILYDCCDRTLRTRIENVWVKRNRWRGSTASCGENWSSWVQGPTACVKNAASASAQQAQPHQPPPLAHLLAHLPRAPPRSPVGCILCIFLQAFQNPRSLILTCSILYILILTCFSLENLMLIGILARWFNHEATFGNWILLLTKVSSSTGS